MTSAKSKLGSFILVWSLALMPVPPTLAQWRNDADRVPAAAEKQIVQSYNAFGFSLFRQIVSEVSPGSNVVISPYGTATALTLAYCGAGGTTRTAIERVLGLPKSMPEDIGRLCHSLNQYLKAVDAGVSFQPVNAIWVDDNIKLSEAFRSLSHNYFNARIEERDVTDPGSLAIIGEWLEAQTNGMLDDLLHGFTSNASIHIVNTVDFRASWHNPFFAGSTRDALFTLLDSSKIQCRMMSGADFGTLYLRAADPGFHAVELPYGNHSFAMTILVPDEGQELGAAIAALDPAHWNQLMQSLGWGRVNLRIPKFEIGSSLGLKEALTALGMGASFKRGLADFSGMLEDESQSFWIDQVAHAGVVDVDEKGTRATAATELAIIKGIQPEPWHLTVDRPFLFVIRERSTDAILFLGRVMNPVAPL